MNAAYCRIANPAATAISYAPDFLVRADGSLNHSPDRAEYAAQGWFLNAIVPPSPPEGYVLSSTVYQEQGDPPLREIVAVYAYSPAPTVYRKFSKLKLEIYLAGKGKIDELDAFLDGTFISGSAYALRRFYDQATNISEDHPLFAEYKAAAQTALGFTDEEMETMLSAILWED